MWLLPPPTKLDGSYVFTPVCLSVCLSFSRIIWNNYLRILTKSYGEVAHHQRTIPLTFGGNPDRRSGFWIRIMHFLKYVIM